MDGKRGNVGSGFSPELRAVETDLREVLTEFESQQQRLFDQRQEEWEAFLTDRFEGTPHEQAVSQASITDRYPDTPDLKRAVNSLLGFSLEYPESCAALTAEIAQRVEMREEARHRLFQLYRDVLIEWAGQQDGITPESITSPEATQQVIEARFNVGPQELRVKTILGDTASEDCIVGALNADTSGVSSIDPPTFRSGAQNDSDELPFAISGSISDNSLSFTIGTQFLAGLSVLTDIVEFFGHGFRGEPGDENSTGHDLSVDVNSDIDEDSELIPASSGGN